MTNSTTDAVAQSPPAPAGLPAPGLLVAALVAAIALRQVVHYAIYGTFVDDAYIFMRYADHLASGDGLTYNAGEHVMGFTSPLYVLLLAVVDLVFGHGHIELGMEIVNTTLFAAAAAILWTICRREQPIAWLLPVLWLFYLPFVDASVNGMETILFVTLVFGALLLALDGGWNWAIVLVALTALTRPEGAIFAGCLAVVALGFTRPRRAPWLGLAGAAALIAGWTGVAIATYGSVLPQSVLAKSSLSAGGLVGSGTNPLDKIVVLALGISSDQVVGKSTAVRAGATLLALVLLAFFALGARELYRKRSLLLCVPLFFIATWLFYVAGEPVRIWSWYAVPTSLALAFCVTQSVGSILVASKRARASSALAVLVGGFCAVSIVAGVHQRQNGLSKTNNQHVALTRFIGTHAPAAHSIMLGDIGIVGWRTSLRIFDLAGLVSKGGTREAHGRLLSLGRLIETERPDLVSLQANPFRERDIVTSGVRRKTFDTAQQRLFQRRGYAMFRLKNKFLFVRRSVLTRRL